MSFLYSAVIRSVGPNNLLDKTLASLHQQTVPPTEILIVIPEDTNTWSVPMTSVRFIHSLRGMVSQRRAGILEARHRYALLLDDDIVFDCDSAVQKLFYALVDYQSACILPYHEDAYPQGLVRRLVLAFFGMAIPTKSRHLGYTAGGGYFYPIDPPTDQPYTTEGGRGCVIAVDRCFLVENSVLGDLKLQTIPYALRDDGAFVSEIYRHGGRPLLVAGIPYSHLGNVRKSTNERVVQAWRATIHNNLLFWQGHIRPRYDHQGLRSVFSLIALAWLLNGYVLMSLAASLKGRTIRPLLGAFRGFRGICRIRGRKHWA